MEDIIRDLQALTAPGDDLALPTEHARQLAERVAAHETGAVDDLMRFVLQNMDDDVFLRGFLPTVVPPVLRALRESSSDRFNTIVRAFSAAAEGNHAFSWTDLAARFLGRVFRIADEPDIRELVLARILHLGTGHNRWAVADIYLDLIADLKEPAEILMVANQLTAFPDGVSFVREKASRRSWPPRIAEALGLS